MADGEQPGPGSGPRPDERPPTSPQQLQLIDALDRQDVEKFRQLLNSPDVQLDYRYNEGSNKVGTCLEIACRWQNRAEFVSLLLEKKVNPNISRILVEPIHYAAKHANPDALRALLKNKQTKIYAQDNRGRTALHHAFLHVRPERLNAHLECIDLLMGKFWKSALNRVDNYGYTAVHLAVIGDTGYKNTAPSMGKEEKETRKKLVERMLDLGETTIDLDTARPGGSSAREDILRAFPNLRAKMLDRSARRDPHQALVDAMMVADINLFQQLLRRTRPDGGPVFDPGHWFGAPMHASCLELACGREGAAPFVAALLEAGADPNVANALTGTYPVHEACKQGLGGNLRALLDNGKTEVNPNRTDKHGNTALHYVVNIGQEGDCDGDPELKNKKMVCLRELLKRDDLDVNILNKKEQRPLHVAVACRNIEAIKEILKDGDDVQLHHDDTQGKLYDLLLEKFPNENLPIRASDVRCSRGANRDAGEKLFYLLKKGSNEDSVELYEFRTLLEKVHFQTLEKEFKSGTLLQFAARYGPAEAVRALLEKGANPNAICSKNSSPPLVLAAEYGGEKILRAFLLHPPPNLEVNASDQKGNTALHYRVQGNCLDTVVLLLSAGANSRQTNNLGKHALSETHAKAFLDMCVSSNDTPPLGEDYEIIFDYKLLVALSKNASPRNGPEVNGRLCQIDGNGLQQEQIPLQDMNQAENQTRENNYDKVQQEMKLLNILCRYEMKELLEHPVVASFHTLKWERMKKYAYINLITYICFVISLNVYISLNVGRNNKTNYTVNFVNTSDYYNFTYSVQVDNDEDDPFSASCIFLYILLLFAFYIFFREVIQFYVDKKRYLKNYENYLDISLLVCTALKVAYPFGKYGYWLDVFTIMLSCVELLHMISRVSKFAKYIHMLQVVLKTYFFISVPYATILLAFALSFHTVFARETMCQGATCAMGRFQTIHMSVVKVIIMMTGEFESENVPLEDTVLGVLLFVVFVALVTIVLLNLLIGLAVSDTQAIKDDADMLWLQTRVRILVDIENIAVRLVNKHPRLSWLKGVLLFPDQGGGSREGWVRPNGAATLNLRVEDEGRRKGRKARQRIVERALRILSERQSADAERPEDAVADGVAKILDIVKNMAESGVVAGCLPGSPLSPRAPAPSVLAEPPPYRLATKRPSVGWQP